MTRTVVTLFFLAALSATSFAQGVRVSEPVVHYASPQLFSGDPLDRATLHQSRLGRALLWYESGPGSSDRVLHFAPLRNDGTIDPAGIREVLPYPGPTASASEGREVLVASLGAMLVFDITGYVRNSFTLPERNFMDGIPPALSAGIVDGEYRSAVLTDFRALEIRAAKDDVTSSSIPWNFGSETASLFTGRAGTIVAATGLGCVLLYAPCNAGILVGIVGDQTTGGVMYAGGEPVGAPAIASNGRDFLLAWRSQASGCGTGEFSETCNAIRIGRVTQAGAAADPAAGVLAGTSADRAPAIAAAWTGRHYVVVWESSTGATAGDIHGAVVSPNGTVASSFVVASTERNEVRPTLSVSPAGTASVTYLSGSPWRIESREITILDGRRRAAGR